MDRITLNAYAKINLGLDVLGKRDNGYHDVRMIMQTVKLFDKIFIKKVRKPGIIISTNLSYLPVNENNIVYAAADLFKKTYNINDGVYISLEKKIPVAAGMAGGSTDAASTLVGLNQIFKTGLSLVQLQELGVKLGADVPYCLQGGTALSEGIGELLTPLKPAPSCYCLIVKPNFAISTRYVYEHLSLNESIKHPNIDLLLSAVERNDIYTLASSLGNILETVSIPAHREIAEIKDTMLELGALGSLMSGSGPTVFGLFDNTKAAEAAYQQFKSGPYARQSFLTTFFQPTRIK